MIEQRMWIYADADLAYYRNLIALAKKHPGACDGFWLGIVPEWTDMTVHERFIAAVKPIVSELQDAGFRISLQGITTGHGEGADEGFMETIDAEGRLSGHNCVRNERLIEQVSAVYELYARELKPYAVLPDDDLRLRDWTRAPHCLCDRCLARFNQQYGTQFDRDTMVKKIQTDIGVRKQFLSLSYDGLAVLGAAVARAVKRGCADTLMGLQNGGYGGEGFLKILEAMHAVDGKPVLYRAGAGGYSDRNPTDILDKAHTLDYQLSRLPDYVIERCPEIENYPHSYYGKSPYGMTIEAALHLAQGYNFVSIVAFMSHQEDLTFVENIFSEFSIRRKYLERLIGANVGTHRSGMQIFVSENYFGAPQQDWYNISLESVTGHSYHGMPVTYQKQSKSVYLLHGKFAECLTDQEICFLASVPVLTDGETLAVLARRGYGTLLGATAREGGKGSYVKFTEHQVNDGLTARQFHTAFNERYFTIKGGEALSYYAEPDILANRCDNDRSLTADAILTTACGAKWAVFGCAAWSDNIGYPRRMQIYHALDYIGAKPSVFIEQPNRLVLLPRENADDRTTSVTVYNASISDAESLSLCISNPSGDRFTFMIDDVETEVKAVIEDGNVIVSLPPLKRYTIGTLFIS